MVVGNPPYVRQELLGGVKPYLQEHFATYHGMADLYVYFFERGLDVLRPGGRLSFIVTNKWMKAGYGAPLRRFFAEKAWVDSVVDFGHAKQIFEDADVFPSIVVVQKPVAVDHDPEAPEEAELAVAPATTRVSVIQRERLRTADLQTQVDEVGFEVPREQLAEEGWRLEPPGARSLLAKIREKGVPLEEYAGVKPYYGIKTGYNKAFLIDTATRDRLVAEDPKSAEIVKPYLRGQDVQRWVPAWDGLWMIFTRRGIDIDTYPAVRDYLEQYRKSLEPRPEDWDQEQDGRWPGRKPGPYAWYEIQDSIAYWELFDRPKIVYQEIQFHPAYALDASGLLMNNKVFFVACADPFLLAALNSPLLWWHNWRYLSHMKDEALNPAGYKMEQVPIAIPDGKVPEEAEAATARLIQLEESRMKNSASLLDWLRVEHEIEKPGRALESPFELSSDEFVEQVRKRRPSKKKLSAAALRSLRPILNSFQCQVVDSSRLAGAEIRRGTRISGLVARMSQRAEASSGVSTV